MRNWRIIEKAKVVQDTSDPCVTGILINGKVYPLSGGSGSDNRLHIGIGRNDDSGEYDKMFVYDTAASTWQAVSVENLYKKIIALDYFSQITLTSFNYYGNEFFERRECAVATVDSFEAEEGNIRVCLTGTFMNYSGGVNTIHQLRIGLYGTEGDESQDGFDYCAHRHLSGATWEYLS